MVRDERPADRAAVRDLVTAAFGTHLEARLVAELQADGDAALSLVATDGDAVIGHLLLSRLDAPFRALALAPLAVQPGRHRQGIGGTLIREGLRRAAADGWDLVFVLGYPDYYLRFGFDLDLAARFRTPWDGPFMMAMALSDRPRPEGAAIAYPKAFANLA